MPTEYHHIQTCEGQGIKLTWNIVISDWDHNIQSPIEYQLKYKILYTDICKWQISIMLEYYDFHRITISSYLGI